MMAAPTLPIEFADQSIIGSRSLRALQLVRIGRHTSSALLVPRDGIWVVAGRGPEAGSNGAGKTVLLGALSLHSGDAQWRGDSGIGPYAARLLFDHNRARVTDPTHGDALHGYIAGVFLEPGSLDSAISVWMRIERYGNPDYVQVRWTYGIRLAAGDSEKTRYANANEIWDGLRGQRTLKVTEYATALYGRAPRCIAYIRARGSEENQDRGLLALGQRPFRPADLASQIINLAGKQQAVENEREFRIELSAIQTTLENKKRDYSAQFQREEQELRDIAQRKKSRIHLAHAATAWNLFLTISALLDHEAADAETQRADDLQQKIDAAEAAIKEATAQLRDLPPRPELIRRLAEANRQLGIAINDKNKLSRKQGAAEETKQRLDSERASLRNVAGLAPGILEETAEASLQAARSAWLEAGKTTALAETAVRNGLQHLKRLQTGRGGAAGQALEALEAAGVSATSLLDLITLTNDSRAHWEARLSPYAGAVVIAGADDSVVRLTRRVLAEHPGTPVLFVASLDTLPQAAEASDGALTALLTTLEERMPADGPGWVADTALNLAIPGGFTIPLTDRHAAISASAAELRGLSEKLADAKRQQAMAHGVVRTAEWILKAAQAATRLRTVETELGSVTALLAELPGLAATAQEVEEKARESAGGAQEDVDGLDGRIGELTNRINTLRSGPEGTTELRGQLADARLNANALRLEATKWQDAAGIRDLSVAQQRLADDDVAVSAHQRETAFHEARQHLRHAITAVHVPDRPSEDAPTATVTISPEKNRELNDGLATLYRWCDDPLPAKEPKAFDAVARPLTQWLDWNGAEDQQREETIHTDRVRHQEEIEAADRAADEAREWITSQRETQIAIVNKAFHDTERTLNELLESVNKDPIKLRPKHLDIEDTSQPLRWEVHPQWTPANSKPVEYTNPPNTAELIILHVLLATASLVAASRPRGRMLILDESGNNLDGPNLSKVAAVLQQIAEKNGLTVVLACQDIYTDRVAAFSAGEVQLLRHSNTDPLNAPPTIMHGREDPEVLETLLPYLNMGRPDPN